MVLSADSIVVRGGATILEKPADDDDALKMLKSLNGDWHQVITAVAIFTATRPEPLQFHESTLVQFGKNSDALLSEYVATGEPRDKAGAYGIQGKGRLLVQRIEGCYYNTVGLPIFRVYHELRQIFNE